LGEKDWRTLVPCPNCPLLPSPKENTLPDSEKY